MTIPLRVLLAEDNAADTELILRELRRAGFEPEWERVDTESAYQARLRPNLDIILSDYAMPEFSGPRALELLQASGLDLPFIIISGTIGEEAAVTMLKLGAVDYLLKDRLTRLGPAVTQALEKLRLSREQKRAGAALQDNRDRLVLATESTGMGIWDWAVVPNTLTWDARMHSLYGIAEQDFSGTYDAWRKGLHPEDLGRWDAEIAVALRDLREFHTEFRIVRPGGAIRTIEAHAVVQRADDGSAVRMIGVNWDITARKLAEAALEKTQQDLVRSSRQAGMAEVATSVLHNVGNVLNSVNVSASVVMDSARNSRAGSMARVATLLLEHMADLGTFITTDPKGRHIPAFLQQISRDWLAQQNTLLKELESLRANIDHIKSIVARQQTYAKAPGTSELVSLAHLVEESLRLEQDDLVRDRVQVIRDFEPVPPISTDRHKILQILVNLVRNAKYACDEPGGAGKVITLRIEPADGRIRISVGDNGVGIAPENLTRIFSHGFTTRKDGHGFGLHSSAIAATELGGNLSVHSAGRGKGATFTLELPIARAEPALDAPGHRARPVRVGLR